MATIFKRKWKSKTTYRCTVRRRGFKAITKSFNSKPDAIKWGREMERNLDKGISSESWFRTESHYNHTDTIPTSLIDQSFTSTSALPPSEYISKNFEFEFGYILLVITFL